MNCISNYYALQEYKPEFKVPNKKLFEVVDRVIKKLDSLFDYSLEVFNRNENSGPEKHAHRDYFLDTRSVAWNISAAGNIMTISINNHQPYSLYSRVIQCLRDFFIKMEVTMELDYLINTEPSPAVSETNRDIVPKSKMIFFQPVFQKVVHLSDLMLKKIKAEYKSGKISPINRMKYPVQVIRAKLFHIKSFQIQGQQKLE